MPSLPFITGIGLATPLGKTAHSTWQALCAGEAILSHSRVPGIDAGGRPRVNAIALHVAREAVAEAGWSADDIHCSALIVGTSKGPVDDWLENGFVGSAPRTIPRGAAINRITGILPVPALQGHGQDAHDTEESSGARQIVPRGMVRDADPTISAVTRAFGLAETAAMLARDFRIEGPSLTLSAACSSGLHALIRGALMIRAGEVRRALIVAAESSLHPLFVASFQRLGVIPPEGFGCRPFDRDRAGFLVSEAAAAICLEAVPRIGMKSLTVIDCFAMGADATHLTGGDPTSFALRRVLASAIDGRAIDLVHAHGTGTVANDPVELAAIEDSLHTGSSSRPSLYSHKGAIGHSLGASGLVATDLNALCHRHGIVPPNVHSSDPLPSDVVAIDQSLARRSIRRSLIVAAGFGGALSAVSLSVQ